MFEDLRLPAEMLEEILFRVPVQDLPNCRLVCSRWRHILDSKTFWREKFRQLELPFAEESARKTRELVQVCENRDLYGRNLVRNGDCDGECYAMRDYKFPHWNHVGKVHSNWTRGAVSGDPPGELLRDTGGTRNCFSVALTYGPNEFHQKIKWAIKVVYNNFVGLNFDSAWP